MFAQRLPSQSSRLPQDILTFVNPLIGTGGNGRAFPGATVPYGMIQLSPDTYGEGIKRASGYHYSDSIIVAFSHTHLHGATFSDLLDVGVMPTVKPYNLLAPSTDKQRYDWAATFSHRHEQAKAGLYSVVFSPNAPNERIAVELTATDLVGFHRYTFPASQAATIILDLNALAEADTTSEASIRVRSKTLITGYRHSRGTLPHQQVFFAIEFSKPFTAVTGTHDLLALQKDFAALTGTATRAAFTFTTKKNEAIVVKVALSSASVEGALDGLKTAEKTSFDQAVRAAEAAWRKAFERIQVSTTNRADKTMFYTALYHSLLVYRRYSDANGAYALHAYNDSTRSYTTTITTAIGWNNKPYKRLDGFSPAATFAHTQLMCLLQPEQLFHVVETEHAHYLQSGVLPKYLLWGNELMREPSYRSIAAVSEQYAKGWIADFDQADTLYTAIGKTLAQDTVLFAAYNRYGYVPADIRPNAFVLGQELNQALWHATFMAKYLEHGKERAALYDQALLWRRSFDTETMFFRPRLANGQWQMNTNSTFNPDEPIGTIPTIGKTRSVNIRQASLYMQDDMLSVVGRSGGNVRYMERLDTLFLPHGKPLERPLASPFLHYDHANERLHHVPYLYMENADPSKTQARVRQIVRTFYAPAPEGLCSEDEGGKLSAWLVMNMIGLYSFVPQNALYTVNTPFFDKITYRSPAQKTLTINAKNVSDSTCYIQSATYDREVMPDHILTQRQIIKFGGVVTLKLGAKPSTFWKLPR